MNRQLNWHITTLHILSVSFKYLWWKEKVTPWKDPVKEIHLYSETNNCPPRILSGEDASSICYSLAKTASDFLLVQLLPFIHVHQNSHST